MSELEAVITAFPSMYKAIRDYVVFNFKMDKMFERKYGVDTIENIIKSNEFLAEIENVEKGKLNDTTLNKNARKRASLLKIYIEETGKVASKIGHPATLKYIDLIEDYVSKNAPFFVG